jgi:hypothetical protein
LAKAPVPGRSSSEALEKEDGVDNDTDFTVFFVKRKDTRIVVVNENLIKWVYIDPFNWYFLIGLVLEFVIEK